MKNGYRILERREFCECPECGWPMDDGDKGYWNDALCCHFCSKRCSNDADKREQREEEDYYRQGMAEMRGYCGDYEY